MSSECELEIVMYDALGATVDILARGRHVPGTYVVESDAGGFSSGVYVYRMTAGRFTQSRRAVHLR